MGGGFFNLPADVGHVDAQDFVVALGAGPPELLHEKVIGQHTSGIFAQQRHDAVFTLGELRIHPVHIDAVLVIVDGQAAGVKLARAGNLSVLAHGLRMPQGHADARQQLGGAEGLGDVVIRTQIDSLHLVRFMGSGRKHNHGRGSPLAHGAEQGVAIHIRQAQVQKDQIRAMGCDQGQGLCAGGGLHHLVLVGGENGAQQLEDAFFILHNQQFDRHIRSPFPAA